MVKHLSDLEKPRSIFEGIRVDFKDLVGKTFVVKAFKEVESQKYVGDTYVIMQTEMNGNTFVTMTFSRVIKDQLKRHINDLPLQVSLDFAKSKYYVFR